MMRVLDYAERLFLVSLWVWAVVRIVPSLADRPWNGVYLFTGGMVALFTLIRREGQMSQRWADWAVALIGTMLTFMFSAGGDPLIPKSVGWVLAAVGGVLPVWAKFTMRRSHGVVPANRGVKTKGPYAFIRNPMYLGYFIEYAGFLLMNPTGWNLAIAVSFMAFQVARIFSEETLLLQDAKYRDYFSRVRWRLLPGVF